MLGPEHIRPRAALHETMHVLRVRIVRPLGRHVRRTHALRALHPGCAVVVAAPYSARGNADADHARIARIDADAVNARLIETAAEPLFALVLVPQRAHELPACRVVVGTEQAAGDRAGPQA